MKKITITFTLLALALITNAQVLLYNNGSIVQVNTGCIVKVNGNFTNTTGSALTNNGTLTVTGNSTNNQLMTSPNDGLLEFSGSTAQSLNGTATYFAKNVLFNNAAGVMLNTPLKADGLVTFTNGIVTAAAATTPMIFTTNATTTGAANASHINGYVVKEGTGSFTYPVGDGTRYQQCAVNLSANGSGMQVKYNVADAGAGTFTTGGTETTALIAYNKLEHWDISPLSTATGTVTIHWDATNNEGILNVTDLKVAHKTGGSWLNEGGTGTGTISAGNITSNAISTWSPFTLGSYINSTLPLQWLAINGNINANKQAELNFKVNEANVANFAVEKSIDGTAFNTLATIISKGNGENNYQFTENTAIVGTQYYRIKQTDINGRYSYSTIVRLSINNKGTIAVYPNPVKDIVTVNGAKMGRTLSLIDINGKILERITVTTTSFTIDMSIYNGGTYFLKGSDGKTVKILKQ